MYVHCYFSWYLQQICEPHALYAVLHVCCHCCIQVWARVKIEYIAESATGQATVACRLSWATEQFCGLWRLYVFVFLVGSSEPVWKVKQKWHQWGNCKKSPIRTYNKFLVCFYGFWFKVLNLKQLSANCEKRVRQWKSAPKLCEKLAN